MIHQTDLDLNTLTITSGDQELVLTREDFSAALTIFRFMTTAELASHESFRCFYLVLDAERRFNSEE